MESQRMMVLGVIVIGTVSALSSLSCKKESLPEKKTTQTVPQSATTQQGIGVEGAKILLVHSYHPEYPWVDAITRGVQETLKDTGAKLDIFYMDTKRKTDEAWKVRAGELALEEMKKIGATAVITADDNAQQYFGKKLVGTKTPLVFCGVNDDPSKYGYPAKNVTGIIERPLFSTALKFVSEVRPLKRVAMLSDDCSTSVGAFNFMKEVYIDPKVADWKIAHNFEEWKTSVLRYNKTVDAVGIYMYHTVKEKPGSENRVDPVEVMKWTNQNLKIPSLGFFEFGVEDGLLMGVVESGLEHGEKATKYLLEILRGTPLSSLPVIQANIGTRMVNTDTAQRLGITLPKAVLDNSKVVTGEGRGSATDTSKTTGPGATTKEGSPGPSPKGKATPARTTGGAQR